MLWNSKPRRPDRRGRLPGLESLETRNLLSTTLADLPAPAAPVPAEMATSASLQPHDALIGASVVRATHGVDGTGLTAAVIDTGVNYRHQGLGGSFGETAKVVAGVDYGDGDADPDASTWQHGTHVAGLIASTDPAAPGVAPGAEIAAVRVFGSDNKGTYDRIADALQWVLDNADRYAISVVNLSITDNGNYATNPFFFSGGVTSRIESLVHQLRLRNIPVVSAAGNSFNGQQGMGFTAILPETISVTATDRSDKLLGDAQRLGSAQGGKYATDLAAPGYELAAPSEGQSNLSVTGTSFAAPIVSGAIVLLQSLYLKRFGVLPSVDQLETWLRDGADRIADGATGISLPRLNLARSAALVPGKVEVAPPAKNEPAPAPAVPPTPAPPAAVETPATSSPIPPSTSPPSSGNADGSQSGSQPVATPVPELPAEPPVQVETRPDAQGDALTDLYEEGEFAGSVAGDDPTNPLAELLPVFGLRGRVTRVETWQAAREARGASTALLPVAAGRAEVVSRDEAGPIDEQPVNDPISEVTSTLTAMKRRLQAFKNRSRWSRVVDRLARR